MYIYYAKITSIFILLTRWALSDSNPFISTNKENAYSPVFLLHIGSYMSDGMVVRTKQGLAFGKRSEGWKTLVETLKNEGVISQAVFAFHLTDNSGTELPPSAISIGSWSLSKYALDEDFTYLYLYDKSG